MRCLLQGPKAGQLQRACLTLLQEHEADGALPTSERFLWYELVQRGVVDKNQARGKPGVRRGIDQDVSKALTQLRERGVVPWTWIVDETRSVAAWESAPTVAEFVARTVQQARIDCWGDEAPPFIICESRSLAGVLRNIASTYLCPIAATNGQVGGFLHTDVAPLLQEKQRVLYWGTWTSLGITSSRTRPGC